jgi:hypothetical protein
MAGEALSWARLRIGTELSVIDISDHGALVESRARLLPGTHVDLHLMSAAGRVLQRGRVVRAFVARLDASVLSYYVALAFDGPVDTSPPRVVPAPVTRPAWAGATPEREAALPIAPTLTPPAQSRPGHLAPVLETGPRTTSDL